MNLGVDDEGRGVHRPVTLDDVAVVVHEDQVAHPDLLEVHGKRIDPEVVEPLRVASRDVTGDAFVETKCSEQAKRGGEALLAVAALVGRIVELRKRGELPLRGHQGSLWLSSR